MSSGGRGGGRVDFPTFDADSKSAKSKIIYVWCVCVGGGGGFQVFDAESKSA